MQKKLENRRLRQQQADVIPNNQDDAQVQDVVDKLKQSSIKGGTQSENATQKNTLLAKPKSSNVATANQAPKVVSKQNSAPAAGEINSFRCSGRS